MSDNPRPVLYGAGYEAFLPAPHRRAARASQCTIVGKHCEQGDILVAGRPAPRRRRGGRPARHPGHRRLRVLDGVQLQQGPAARGRLRPRRRRPGSWFAGSRSTTSCGWIDDWSEPVEKRARLSAMGDLVRVGLLGCGNVGSGTRSHRRRARRPDHGPRRCPRRDHPGRGPRRAQAARREAAAAQSSPTTRRRWSPIPTSTSSSR